LVYPFDGVVVKLPGFRISFEVVATDPARVDVLGGVAYPITNGHILGAS
jgi:hypothetical protein